MNGWQRLWVFVSGIYLVIVVVFAVISFPKPESIYHTQMLYDQLAPEVRQKIIGNKSTENYRVEKHAYVEEALKRGLVTEVEMPNNHILVFSSGLQKQEMEAVAKQYWSVVEKAATKKRVWHIVPSFLWCVLPILTLYGFGLSVGWVYRGFRKNTLTL
jgi:hypothetical protein